MILPLLRQEKVQAGKRHGARPKVIRSQPNGNTFTTDKKGEIYEAYSWENCALHESW